MKSTNKKERIQSKLKFAAIYGVTITLVVVVLSGFWSPAIETKTVVIESRQPAKEIIKEVKVPVIKEIKVPVIKEVKVPVAAGNNKLIDSLSTVLSLSNNNVTAIALKNEAQKKLIADLQAQLKRNISNVKVVSKTSVSAADSVKQLKFYDWALRSQVVINDNLTKENNELKAKLAAMNRK